MPELIFRQFIMEKILYVEFEEGKFKTDTFIVKKETNGTVETIAKDGTKRKFFKSNLEKNKSNYIIDPFDELTEKNFFLQKKKTELQEKINSVNMEIENLK